ncbi:MAG: hypothetical protein HFE77_04975 [Clostridiales bacterium]|nr:hypothetical protein [Clostridiales bacterium]
MKKFLCFTLLCALFLTLLCGCSDKDKQTENTEPDTTATEPATEPSTETPTAPPTEPTTEAPTEPEGLQLNMDLLNDIGLTYDQLTEKYGELIKYNSPHGGYAYNFKNGHGSYNFYGADVLIANSAYTYYNKLYITKQNNIYYNHIPNDDQGDFIPIPKEDAECCSIEDIKATDIFVNVTDTVLISDIKNIDGMIVKSDTHEHALDFDPPTPGAPKYVSSFQLKGYDHIIITFSHENFDSIDSDSILDLHFPPKR